MIKIDSNTEYPDKPRVGQFGGLRIKGQGDLSGWSAIIVQGNNTAPKAYVTGDLIFVDANNDSLGKEITLASSSIPQSVRIRATSLNGGYLFIANQVKLGQMGSYVPSTYVINSWFTLISNAETYNSPLFEFTSKLIMPFHNVFQLSRNPVCRYVGQFADLPRTLKILSFNCDGKYADSFPTDYDSLLNDGREVIQLTSDGSVQNENPITITKSSDTLKSLRIMQGMLKMTINGSKYPNLENLYLDFLKQTNTEYGDLTIDLNGLTKLKQFRTNTNGVNPIGVNKINMLPIDMDNLPPELQVIALNSNTSLSTWIAKFDDLANLPDSIRDFIYSTSGTPVVNYSGKVWGDTLERIGISNAKMSADTVDLLLNDLDRDIVTWSGVKSISLWGARTSVSDAAVASLVAKGVTVTITA